MAIFYIILQIVVIIGNILNDYLITGQYKKYLTHSFVYFYFLELLPPGSFNPADARRKINKNLDLALGV